MQLSLPIPDPAPPAAPPVVFIRHRRARRFIVRVLDNGTVRVTLPRWAAKRDARAFVDACQDWINRQRHAMATRPAPDVARDAALRRQARRELPQQLLALAAVHQLTVKRVSVRNQRSRWGSCSRAGTITLNWRLVQTPPFVREYVMLHELMHLREMNHSTRFWKLVAACCPRYLEARAWLRKEGKSLWSDCD